MYRIFCSSLSKQKPWLALMIAWFFATTSFAQERVIEGTIYSGEDGQPLPGVNILIKGSQNGTISDFDGNYKLVAPSETYTLIFSYIGYVTQEVVVTTQSKIDITLETDAEQLDEIIVVGYGVEKKSVVTGAIASVKEADIVKTPVVEAGQALQGRTPGVVVTALSGQPGAGIDVKVRGTGSNTDNTPLYVIDGVQTTTMNHLNPGDIASIEVLKDAASAAVYGARGANGVVLVTTKKGKEGKMTINYDGYYGVQSAWHEVDVLDAYEYMVFHNEGALRAGNAAKFSQEQIASNTVNTNWQDELFDTAPITSHTLTLSGGNENSTYLVSTNYFGQQGFVAKDKSNFDRLTFRLNSNHKISDIFTFGENLSFTRTSKEGIVENNEFGSVLQEAILHDPLTPVFVTDESLIGEYDKLPNAVKNDDGYYYGISQQALNEIKNPLAGLQNNYNETFKNDLFGNVYLEVNPLIEGLKFKTDLGFQIANERTRGYNPKAYYNVVNVIASDGVSESFSEYTKLQWENVLSYNKTIGDHQISALAGTTLLREESNWAGAGRSNMSISGWENAYVDNGAADDTQSSWGSIWEHRLLSYFARVGYNYKDKYMINGVVRYDGSSRFGSNNQYGLFKSIQGGWVLTEEDFMANNSVVNFLKLRVGYGETGNEAIGDFQYLSLIGGTSNYIIGTDETPTVGFGNLQMANPDLKWEHSQEINIGIDAGFWNDKVTMNVDVYNRLRKDLLGLQPIPGYTGIGAPSANLGDVLNQGVELAISYRKREGQFHYSITGNVSYNDNEVQKVATGDGKIYGGKGFNMDGQLVMEEGYALPYFWGYKTDGILQNETEAATYNDAFLNREGDVKAVPGDIRFVDINGDGRIDGNDRTAIGDPQHDWTYGLTVEMDYKGFDFSMFWQGQEGGELFNATQRVDLISSSNFNTRYLDRWTGEGSTNSFPRFTHNDTNGNFTRMNDMVHIEDASYLRLKNIQLGYTLPRDLSSQAGISKARFYVSVQNAFTFTEYTGMDPEVGFGGAMNFGIDRGTYPQARTFLVGANLTF